MLSRRDLLASLAAAPLRLPKKVRVVMIGLQGHPGEITGQLRNLPDVELVGIVEPDAKAVASAKRSAAAANARVYTDYRAMLDQEKPDVVGICNPADQRAAAALEATRRGLPWIAEKPFADTLADLAAIRKAAAAGKVRFSTLLPMRFDPPYRALRRIVESGALGDIGQISSQKSYKAGSRAEWMRVRKTYGGTIAWIGIHMIDLMLYSSGRDFKSAFSFQGQVAAPPGIGQMENTTATVFKMDNGGTATLHMDYYRPESAPTHGDDRLRLAGSKGVAEYTQATGVTLIQEGSKPVTLTDLPPQGSVFQDFLDALYNGRPQTLSEAAILRTCEIALATRDAAEAGRIAAF